MGNFAVILLRFVVYLLLQILFFKDVTLFNRAICLIYIVPLLLLPFDIRPWQAMLLAFGLGFLTDVFYATGGIHAAACVLMAYVRPRILNLIVPRGGYEPSVLPLFFTMGPRWFLTYAAIMTALHHLTLFFIEAFTFANLLQTLLTSLFSTLFTLSVTVILQVFFHRT